MKPIKFAKLLVLGLVLNLAAIGCHKHKQGVTEIPGVANSGSTNDLGNAPPLTDKTGISDSTFGTPITDPEKYKDYAHNTEIFKSDTVHFAFDSSVVKEDEKSKVSTVADYLKSNSADAVEVDGHCDERGTEEYNRSLGERRALALREELIRLGIDAGKVVTMSYGKDRPEDQGHDESAWKANRRGVFMLLTPPSKVQ